MVQILLLSLLLLGLLLIIETITIILPWQPLLTKRQHITTNLTFFVHLLYLQVAMLFKLS